MKKTLLAAALLTGGFAGTAMAQNSVTLYGRLAPWMLWDSVKVPDAVADRIAGVSAGTSGEFAPVDGFAPGGSLWGMRGVEDLGDGFKATFALESAINVTSGASTGFERKAYLGLANDAWGEFRIGRDFLPSDDMLSGISPLGVAYGVGSAQRAFGVFTQNVGSQISFRSASISGFQVGLAYSFGGARVSTIDADLKPVAVRQGSFGSSKKNRLLNAGVRYANGPILLGAAYTQIFVANSANIDNNKGPKNWVVGGAYDFKVVRVNAAYGQNIDGRVGGSPALTGLTGGAAVTGQIGTPGQNAFGVVGSDSIAQKGARTNQWMAGLSAPVGSSGTAMFGISQQAPGGVFKQEFTATQTNLGVAYQYRMSPRTSLYASYSYATNYYMLKGVTANQVGVGVVHTF